MTKPEPATSITGIRVDPVTGEPVEVADEREH